ncbi:MAG: AcrR family transcriptional regulator [Parasphingorhabdus sp.]|jgi:AcrR family transcriptional regulator
MPKIIDHDHRREEIAGAVLRVVGQHGVNGVTMRVVAKEAGWSTGVLHHYFEDKQALLVGGLRLAARITGKHIKKSMDITDPKQQLRLVLEAGVPLDQRREVLCRIFFFFWAEGVGDSDLSKELARYYDWWKKRLINILEVGQKQGWVRQDISSKMLAEMLVALADGVAVQARFSSPKMSKPRLRKHVGMWIENLHPGSPA